MNRLNRIFYNKRIKFLWFLTSFARYMTPKVFLQSRLERVLARAQRRPDWDYISRRADYYNRLDPQNPAGIDGLWPLAQHRLRKGIRSAYFFDTYEYTRWFDNRLRWNTVPGDVTQVPEIP